MKVTLIAKNFNSEVGQGIFKFCGEFYNALMKNNPEMNIKKIEIDPHGKNHPIKNALLTLKEKGYKNEIYHILDPELGIAGLFKKKVIVTIYDLIPLMMMERKKTYRLFFKTMLKCVSKADHFIAISECTKKDMVRILKIPPKKITPIYPGVNFKKFYPKKRKRNKIFTVGYVGGLGKRKNVEFILNLAKKMEKEKIIFKICGKGPEYARLIKIKEHLGINNIKFMGFLEEKKLNNFYNSLDLFIFPSKYEGFGFPVAEAMATGTPVIVSNRGSLPEIADKFGICLDLKQELFIKGIKKLMKDKKLQKRLSEESKKFVKKFSWENNAKKTIQIYNRLIET